MAGDNTTIFNDSEFDSQVAGKVALVDFWATWCGPCRQQGPVIDELATELKDKDFIIGKLNVDDNQQVAAKFGVMNIPTLLVLKDGELVKKFVGFTDGDTLKDALTKA